MLRDGWKSVGQVFLLALLLDVAYRIIVQRFVYPVEALRVAFVLAIVPYLIVRGAGEPAVVQLTPGGHADGIMTGTASA